MLALALALALTLALGLALAAAPARAADCGGEVPRIVSGTYYGTECDDTYRAPRSVTRVYGEGGNDTLYGQRGNDYLFGGPGNDRLYGGIGDDQLRGGPGDDLLSGGFGADSALDGEAGDDLVRGDATIDRIENTGGGFDTLSYATGVTPGFFDRDGVSEYSGLPGRDGRGAYIDLEAGLGDNGLAPAGGGVDLEVDGAGFEVVIGSAFSDYIVGTDADQIIYGGGGADVILGKGGNDEIYGGAEGDYCEAATGTTLHECEKSGSEREVEPRDPGGVATGEIAPGSAWPAALYLTGSDGADELTASYADPPGPSVEVTFAAGASAESFTLSEPPDSLLLAGLGGDDTLSAAGFPESTSIVALGGAGDDQLTGGATEDALVDGDGDDTVSAGAGDDAVPNNEGADALHAGPGEDLFVNDAVCEGDLLDGGPDRDNANWANFDPGGSASGISIDMAAGRAGLAGPGGQPACSSGSPTALSALEDVEGSSYDDVLTGDPGDNQLLGRPGHDSYFAAAGNDHVLANSGDTDLAIDCGDGWDTALIDIPTASYADPTPVECEDVEQRPVNSFRPPGTPPDPNPPAETPLAESSSVQPLADRTPPRTRLLHRPARRVFTRRKWRHVAFVLHSSEPGSRFRCRVDRRRFRPCRSPRGFNLRLGRHVFRAYAIDAAGNRDRSPLVYGFAVRRLIVHSSRSHRRRGSTR